jgi:hypothetical protein
MLDVAQRLDALIQQLEAEGVADVVVTADDYRVYQERLSTQGFSPQEREIAYRLGLGDEALERTRLHQLTLDPDDLAGANGRGGVQGRRTIGPRASNCWGCAISRCLKVWLRVPRTKACWRASMTPSSLSNSLPQAAEIDLRLRLINLPPD